MEIVTNEKMEDQEVGPECGDMEQLNSDAEELAVENVKSAVDFGCMGVFPEEVWLHVLDKLAHSEDIVNVLKAFPELDKAFQSKKAYWLFDQVLPHLMTKYLVLKKNYRHRDRVKSRELLKLRLISKRWKKAVEMAIENHADRHPSSSGSKNGKHSTSTRAAVGLPINHFNYDRINKYHLGATVFRTLEQMGDFQTEMANFPGNPFPGKDVCFEIGRRVPVDRFQDFVKKAMELLQKFGHHVLVLSLEIRDGSECFLEMCKAILKGLSSVPNLRSLKIWGCLDWVYEATHEYFREAENMILFPKMEKMESFDWQLDTPMFDRCSWVDHMINLYGGRGRGGDEQNGLRKLALDHKYWNSEMAANLKNLTDIHLLLDEMKDYDIGDIRNVLAMFPKGQLKKFCLSDYEDVKGTRSIYIDELIGMLAEFQIEHVALEKINLSEKEGGGGGSDALGITSLHLDDSLELSYQFLKGMRNLQVLSVYVPFDVMDELSCRDDNTESFAFKLRQYFWTAVEIPKWTGDNTLNSFDIWKECEQLEMLTATVVYGYDVFDVQFVRECGNKPFWGWSELEEEEVDEEDESEVESEDD